MIPACTDTESASRPPADPGAPGEYVAVYFYDGHGLIPEFERLPSGDPVAAMIELLAAGSGSGRRNFVLPGTLVDSSEREGQEQLVLELSPEHWAQPPGEVYAGIAQITYTLAALEEGKSLLFLDGTVPGEVLDGSFEPLEQPLTRSHFSDVEPWIQVARPVPGATVGREIPVQLALRDLLGRATVEVFPGDRAQGEPIASATSRSGSLTVTIDASEAPGDVTLVVTMTSRDGSTHTTRFPLTVSY